jgi:hypothetical protein
MDPTQLSAEQYDLRKLFKAVGRVGPPTASMGAVERHDASGTVEELDENSQPVQGNPIAVHGFIDGIQATLQLAHRQGRPVVLTYVAAGAAARNDKGRIGGVALREQLRMLANIEDHEWIADLDVNIPVAALTGATPPDMELAVIEHVGTSRDELERIVGDLLDTNNPNAIVVDGTIMGRPVDERVVGVVKSATTRYLTDESELFTLRQGWRSRRFSIRGVGTPRWSCYLQLADKGDGPWNLGLIRLEAFNPDLLDSIGVLALNERQSSRSGDARWDRHLGAMRSTEEFLRSKRPSVFS